jgi:hypothetical protein
MGSWLHRKKKRTDNTQDPTEKAFFSNEIVGNISNALTREGNQNVLDEIKNERRPTRVRIFLSGEKYAIDSKVHSVFLKGLIPHLRAENNGIIKSELPDLNGSMRYLLFEDFNTKGLEGDPMETEFDSVKDQDKPHNFYFFWRAYGRSGKLAGKMGSWGVGKSVFPALSMINSFWAVTVRESDKKAYLIGQSVLRTHNREDEPATHGYFPYGNYGKFEDDGFAIPEDSIDEIAAFSQAFKLKRSISSKVEEREENTGVSLIIPFPRNEVTLDTITYSTIEQFFYPILLGKLEVEVIEEDDSIHLTKDNLIQAVEKINFRKVPFAKESSKDSFISVIHFTKWILSLSEADYINLVFKRPDNAYTWRKQELFEKTEIKRLQEIFNSGAGIAFNIPVKFQPEDKSAELRYFKAYMQKDETLTEPENYFIRNFLTITGVKSLKKRGVRGMVLIDDKDLITFLGHAEGPAHTGWHKDNFKVKYENGEECISFVQRSLEVLHSVLQLPPENLDKDLLKDFFFIESDEEDVY